MEFRHREFDGVPRPRFYDTSSRFSFAPLPPPPPYYDSYFLPHLDTAYAPIPPLSDHDYYSTHGFRAIMIYYRPWSGEPVTGHNPFLPYRLRRDPFLEREYERERIREEVLREEVRRRIIEEEVRWELEMDRYYGLRHPNLGYHGTWPAVQSEQSRISYGCYTRGPRGRVKRKRFEARRRARAVPHKIVEINEAELMSKLPVSEDKVQPPNKKKIQKKKDKQTVQTKDKGNKVERNVSEISHKIMEVTEEETRQPQALLTDKVQSPNKKKIQKKDEQTVQTKEKGNKVERNVSEISHKITEVTEEETRQPQALLKDKVQSTKNQEELRPKAPLPEKALPEDKIKPPPNRKNIAKKGDGNKVLKPESGNKVEQRALSKGPLPEEALPKDKITPPPNRKNIEKKGVGNKVLKPKSGNKVEQRALSKGPLPEEALPKDKITAPSSGENIEKKGDGNKVLKPESGNKVGQIASSQSPKELLKEAEACGSKRKCYSISAIPTPATTNSSTDKVGLRKAKKQKIDKKEYSCTLCQVTVKADNCWLGHLNGKRHRNTLMRLGSKVQMNQKGSSDMDKKSSSGIGLATVKVEMDNADSLTAMPAGEELQTDNRIVKKMQVGHEVHEVVEKNNRLWCERCRYNCTTTVMMTIHLVSEKHKASSHKQ